MPLFENKLEWGGKYSPLVGAVLLLLISLIGFNLVGPLIGMMLGLPFYNGDITSYYTLMITDPTSEPSMQLPMMITQGVATGVGFILIPVLFMIFYERKTVNMFFTSVSIDSRILTLTPVIVLIFMGINAFVIEWNEGLTLPEFMMDIEQQLKMLEGKAKEMTEFLLKFDSWWMFAVGIVVVSIIPGIGEELVYRGFLQNYFHRSSGNIHIAVWVSAILFSAMHLQFYGFLPRMLLGALFGYLYYWSGNLIVPVIAHVFNNAYGVIMFYLSQRSIIDIDVLSPEPIPLVNVIICGIFTVFLLYYFRKLSIDRLQNT